MVGFVAGNLSPLEFSEKEEFIVGRERGNPTKCVPQNSGYIIDASEIKGIAIRGFF